MEEGDEECEPDDSGGSSVRCPVKKHECHLYELYRSKWCVPNLLVVQKNLELVLFLSCTLILTRTSFFFLHLSKRGLTSVGREHVGWIVLSPMIRTQCCSHPETSC